MLFLLFCLTVIWFFAKSCGRYLFVFSHQRMCHSASGSSIHFQNMSVHVVILATDLPSPGQLYICKHPVLRMNLSSQRCKDQPIALYCLPTIPVLRVLAVRIFRFDSTFHCIKIITHIIICRYSSRTEQLNLKELFSWITVNGKMTYNCYDINRFLTYARIQDPRSGCGTWCYEHLL